jgi:hypothetical protein
LAAKIAFLGVPSCYPPQAIWQVFFYICNNLLGKALIDYEIFTPTTELQKKSGINVKISEEDRQNAFRIALINIARFFNISNWEYDDNITLYNKVTQINKPIVQLLQDYFIAYNEWFKFYDGIKKHVIASQDQRYSIDEYQRKELEDLIKKRETTLNALQKEFDRLQFERFKKINGLEGVEGIEIEE